MTSFVRQHKGAVVFSVAFHVAIVGALVLNLRLPSWHKPLAAATIHAVMIDEGALEREQERRKQAVRQETQRRQREEQQRQAAEDAAQRAAEQRQRDQAEASRREQARVAAERQKTEQVERDRVEAEKRRQEQLARDKRQREEAALAAAQAERARQQAESELQDGLRREAEQRASLYEQYRASIYNKILRSWAPPPNVRPGIDCLVNVVQIPGGDVIDVRVASCNADEAIVRSIEAAVRKASPLPKPPDPSLFDRNLNIRFRPVL